MLNVINIFHVEFYKIKFKNYVFRLLLCSLIRIFCFAEDTLARQNQT